MKKFLVYIIILVFPLLIILPFALYCLYYSGELRLFDSYIHRLKKDQLWGLAYSAYDREYKFFMSEELKPDILQLGTSRSLEVDDNIFCSEYSFYNAGCAIQNSQDYLEFLQKLSYNPKLIIIDVNHFFFNSNSEQWLRAVYSKPSINGQSVLQNCTDFITDIIKGKIDFDKMNDNNHIGMSAKMRNDGYTKSGFYNYGSIHDHYKNAKDYNMKNTMNLIKKHTERYQTCNIADTNTINHYRAFLKECKKRNIMVLGFLPPFPHKVLAAMKSDGNYMYINQIYEKMLSSFDNKTAQFLYNYTDVTKIGGEDNNFIDGHHAGVIIDNLVFKDIVSKNEVLSKFFVSPQQLDSINIEYRKMYPKFHDLP